MPCPVCDGAGELWHTPSYVCHHYGVVEGTRMNRVIERKVSIRLECTQLELREDGRWVEGQTIRVEGEAGELSIEQDEPTGSLAPQRATRLVVPTFRFTNGNVGCLELTCSDEISFVLENGKEDQVWKT